MDIWFLNSEGWTHIRPTSIHGMLWLQTHFENHHWEAISSNKVKLTIEDSKELMNDAKKAGLNLNCVPADLYASKFVQKLPII